jgi:primosomal protein N' (replication factor Y)
MDSFYQIAVNFPVLNSVLTYKYLGQLYTGQMVEVPLGKRKSQGVVLEKTSTEALAKLNEAKIKPIVEIIPNSFSVSAQDLALFKWMSEYYHYSLGKLIFDCLPKIMKRPRPPEFKKGIEDEIPYKLNHEQAGAYDQVYKVLENGFSQHYTHGVTGSGKSLVYLKLIKDVLNAGKSAQFLLPEINLTPQFTEMFETYLGHKVYSYHSGVTPSEKYNIWKALNESEEPVLVMGVRSSVFLPMKNLGIIVVDEEHDSSFKQSDRCAYNGRDVAIKKAQIHKCPVLLGSATPSFESYYNFSKNIAGRKYYELRDRVSSGYFPELVLYDSRDRFKEKDPAWPLLDETIDQIRLSLDKGEQVLLFINKLGFSSFVQCRACGHQFTNENCGCDNNLRYFKKKNELSCSHCEFKMPLPDQCPECAGITLMNKGFGTEKVAEVVQTLFPDKVVDRFDRDEIKNTKQLNEKLEKFHSNNIDIMVGTQMLAKGHNFERVNLVVILGIDSMLNFSDFRSTERTYQLAEQVAGRAGRYSKESKVVIQTMNPEHNIFKFIKEHSFNGFYEEEMSLRELCYCPPFSKIVMIYFSSRFRDKVIEVINSVAKSLMKVSFENFQDVRILGPTPLSIEKKANQYSWAIMLKSNDINQMHNLIRTFETNYKTVTGVTYKVDVDPQHVL